MNILIPMAGEGKRFQEKGYKTSKPLILTTDLKTGKKLPMVIASLQGIAKEEDNLFFVIRDFHVGTGIQDEIIKHYPNSKFIITQKLTEGQASSCYLAKSFINNDSELMICSCDNGQIFETGRFEKLKKESDTIIFTYRNHHHVEVSPTSYGWVKTQENSSRAQEVSVKTPISLTPQKDHAISATFWFKKGYDFIQNTEKMFSVNHRINNEFYVDLVMHYAINSGLKVNVFEIQKYLSWGTPQDYENYESTYSYWSCFFKNEFSK